MKKTGLDSFLSFVDDWFESDVEIGFSLCKGKKKIVCALVSDVWYEHDPDGEHRKNVSRKLVVVSGDSDLGDEIKEYVNKWYDKKQFFELVEKLSEKYVLGCN